ncbi:HTH-type transcriptional activator RhaR [Pseudoalteromonas holothuriae]|uniref:HTH-type transcriptional activator RhaR n=1 Tax=Pseudoalteromonas holothuriae TaxID=2963714 RepID=A0A9W4VVG8_9GAMM|nr:MULTISPECIES: AraC family transcriptional regulator [unclassified Pseudoalteromonas]CAH9062164.1 HTH-type transcriptional activator RhaR [Pseudoalteromonas sp. CIP111951]CAH9065709.1 HTH-type transcriptional activator RhaR [Pseudoalteromonas sp. CIP111854]
MLKHALSVGHELITQIDHDDHGSQTHYVITFILNGTLHLDHGESVKVGANMLTLLPAGMPHKLTNVQNLDVWWLSFCPNCFGLSDEDQLMKPFKNIRLGALPVVELNENRRQWISQLFLQLQDYIDVQHSNDLDVFRSFLNLILNEALNASATKINSTFKSSKVVNALNHIQLNYTQPISLKDVALAVHTSPAYLATLVKQQTGYSIGDWITKYRLTQACTILLHTKMSIGEIVEELGWSDTTHFIRQFKKAYAITPAAWRKQHQI